VLDQGTDGKGFCDDLATGQTYTLISAGSISGTFGGLPDGATFGLSEQCGLGAQATPTQVIIHYSASALPTSAATPPSR
jgi:hypothetical protein